MKRARNNFASNPRRRRGLSLMETLMLVSILGILGAGAGQALNAVAKTPGLTDVTLANEAAMVSKMEELRSIPFDNLVMGANVAPYSTSTIRVDILPWDPNGGGYANYNFKRISVTSNGLTLVTMVNKP